MTFYIEFETQSSRMYDTTKIIADSEEKALELFNIANPSCKIRKIEGYHN